MATGQSTRPANPTAQLTDTLTGATFLRMLTRPTATHLAAAATLLEVVPAHVRVIDGRHDPPSAPDVPVIATDVGLAEDGHSLGDRPLETAIAIASDRSVAVPRASLALAGSIESVDGPGIATVGDDLGRALASSVRLFGPFSGRDPEQVRERLRAAGLPTSVATVRDDPEAGRRLAEWVVTTIIESGDRPPSATRALERALGPTSLPDGPTATREGLVDLIETLAWADPGLAVAVVRGSAESVDGRYHDLASTVHATVGELPTDGPDDLVTTTIEDGPPGPTAHLWTHYRLHRPYGLVIVEGDPVRVALASSGSRGASAVLEAVAGDLGGGFWGDHRLAEGTFEATPDTLTDSVSRHL